MRSRFYSPYFIVPKKGGGLRPILDLRVLNRALHKLPFKELMQKRIFESVPGIGSFWFTRSVLCDHRDMVLRHLSRLGLQVNWDKSKLCHVQRISYLGMELDSVAQTASLTKERVKPLLTCLRSF
ncbi:hypothetical protein F2P79_025386 [Pimephales promelas]|nr:hypothetical protein F2P79_025386 [Pimephales promelas]